MADRLANSEANNRRVAFVEQCFGMSGQPLAMPNRLLVGEGILIKMCRKKPKQRQFFLFNDILVYGNIVINKKKYNKQHIMGLENVRLQSVADDGAMINAWQIISPVKSFTVCAATESEKTEWMAHITKCSHDLINKRGQKSTVAEPSPVWIPDSDAPRCMHCRKSEFTVLNRRHHCRKCGIVCCGTCAAKRWLLPHQSSKPLRVCLTCYGQLNAPSTAGGPSGHAAAAHTGSNDVNTESSGEDSSDSDDEGGTSAPSTDQPKFYQGENLI